MLNPFANRKVIRQGEPARAWIRRMPSPPRGSKSPKSVSMTLDVVRADGGHYHVQDRWMVPGEEPISVGSELRVLVDREDRDRIAIDWETTREVYLAKMEERRRLLPLGVPVPAGKLTRKAEQTGLLKADREPLQGIGAPRGSEPEREAAPEPTPAEEAAGVARPPMVPPSAPTPALGGVGKPLAPEPGQPVAPPMPALGANAVETAGAERGRTKRTEPEPAPRRRPDPEPLNRFERDVLGIPEPEPTPKPKPKAKAAESRLADDDLIERLERLAALHSAGELTDDEFTAVKRHLIA